MKEITTSNTASNTTVIEVNGMKMEVDLRYAKRIDEFKVGDKVRVLKKEYGDSYAVLNGVIVGFENFTNLPTIIIATINMKYNESELGLIYYNNKSTDIEVVQAHDDFIPIEKSKIEDKFNDQIQKKENEIHELKVKKQYFIDNFTAYFNDSIERGV